MGVRPWLSLVLVLRPLTDAWPCLVSLPLWVLRPPLGKLSSSRLATLSHLSCLLPIFKGVKKEKFAFFSPEAEMLNGRAAMIGFALLLAIEAQSGTAFF